MQHKKNAIMPYANIEGRANPQGWAQYAEFLEVNIVDHEDK